jgi:Na+-driven multidrug efflux pump
MDVRFKKTNNQFIKNILIFWIIFCCLILYLCLYLISRNVLRLDELGTEILWIAVPAALALAADPLASIVDTIFIGRLGMFSSFFFNTIIHCYLYFF